MSDSSSDDEPLSALRQECLNKQRAKVAREQARARAKREHASSSAAGRKKHVVVKKKKQAAEAAARKKKVVVEKKKKRVKIEEATSKKRKSSGSSGSAKKRSSKKAAQPKALKQLNETQLLDQVRIRPPTNQCESLDSTDCDSVFLFLFVVGRRSAPIDGGTRRS